ncbi:helix-turn-helix domain-containing protein [Rhodocyclus purpureus]|uniref:helix-turn-helix domain-containing protein n=1 Tax=Rhodocyclus purpureus TaxID=1067 RepID=UPI00191437D2|nr:helix-turn-helix domain-containing protein [Rhodocyclus purpureus]MBK5915132.1 hypothetical protein [Rhodocyclus purpureus]
MNNILTIRERLKLSQAAFGKAIGVTQGNVSHYERGQEVPPDVARRVIAAAALHGLHISFDDIYGIEVRAGGSKSPAKTYVCVCAPVGAPPAERADHSGGATEMVDEHPCGLCDPRQSDRRTHPDRRQARHNEEAV